jgi:hypothetical protein
MVETINVPALDRFQIITEYGTGSLVYDGKAHRGDEA